MEGRRAGARRAVGRALLAIALAACSDEGPPAADRDPLPPFAEVWETGNPNGSRLRFLELIRRAQERGDHLYAAEAGTHVARALGLIGRFDEGREVLAAVARQPAADHPRVRLRVLLESGRLFKLEGRSAEALPLLTRTWLEAVEQGEPSIALDAAHLVAAISPVRESEQWTDRALAYAQQSEKPEARVWLGVLHLNRARLYQSTGRHQEALDEFEQARRGYVAIGAQRGNELACELGRAHALAALGRNQEAVALQEALLPEVESLRGPVGEVLEGLALGYAALGRGDASRDAARRALPILSTDPEASRDVRRLERLRRLAGEGSS